tara:strand:- start:508 stop:714 length:207 start_codon:yes stop_codon:yes gene_type:complete
VKARHEFTSDKRYYDYIKVHASIEFIKAAIMADDSDEETICETAFKLSNKLIEEIIKDKKVLKDVQQS